MLFPNYKVVFQILFMIPSVLAKVHFKNLILIKMTRTITFFFFFNERDSVGVREMIKSHRNYHLKSQTFTQSCPTLCSPINYSPPSSSVHGILQARILECAAIPFSRGSSQLRHRTQVSCRAGRLFTI